MEILTFAKEIFDMDYQHNDEVFFAMQGVHVPKQENYIPFYSPESEPIRVQVKTSWQL